jgi:toxin ParE1/3/4
VREVVYRRLAEDDLREIYLQRAEIEDLQSAAALVAAIQDRCEGLATFSERGTPRSDIAPGLRSIPFRRKAVIAYLVRPSTVEIVGIMYGGRDLNILKEPGRLL